MPAAFRSVAIAPGHSARVRRIAAAATRPGFVTVRKTHGPHFELSAAAWDQGLPA